jgi:hypothetical protein
VSMVRSGSPSLQAMLEESISGNDSILSDGERFDFPIPRDCNVVTPAIPIVIVPSPEGTPAF